MRAAPATPSDTPCFARVMKDKAARTSFSPCIFFMRWKRPKITSRTEVGTVTLLRPSYECHCENPLGQDGDQEGRLFLIRAIDSPHNAVYLLLRGAAPLEHEKVPQQIGRVLERLQTDKHLRMLSRQSTDICCLTRRLSLHAACVGAHEPALQL